MTLLRIVSLFILAGVFQSANAQTCSASSCIGAAKAASNTGRQISYDIVIENFGTETLTDVSAIEDLDAVFGAGNYTLLSGPVVSGGASSIVPNTDFDGTIDTELVSAGSTLISGAQTTLSLSVEIIAVTDQGSGLGVYVNQVLASADGNGAATNDLSDGGTDPDPTANNNPTDAGEDDPTTTDLLANPVVGAAKSAMVSGSEVTFLATVENFGNRTLESLSAVDNLDAVFGAGNYSIVSGPALVDDPGTVTLNGFYNGSSESDLLDPASTLTENSVVTIEFVVDVTNPTDLGFGFGVYQNQITASASASGATTSDLSTEGTDPDPDGNSTPNEDRVTAVVLGEEPQIGVAKTVSVSGSAFTVDLYLENLGNATLSSLSLMDDLNQAVGAGNYFVSSAPGFVDNPGTLTLNGSFDGNMDTQLISGGDLTAGDTAQIQFSVTVLSLNDLGAGLGVFENQAYAEGFAPGGGFTSDFSDDGTDPDPNGDGDPTQAGENDPSTFTVAELAQLGVAKEYISNGNSGGSPSVTLQFTVTNFGNRQVSNISVSDDLDAVYGAGNFIHTMDPTYVGGATTLNYNSAFNGSGNTAMLSGGSFLEPGESATFRIQHLVVALTDQGLGVGIYQNQVTGIGTDPNANPISDVSHQGDNPDPDGNGTPDEMDPTVYDLNNAGVIGLAKDAVVNGNEVTFDLYLENLGNLEVQQISVLEDLDDTFGEGNYQVVLPPTLIDDPGTLTLNSAFDGSTERDIFDIASGSALAAGDTATVRLVVDVTNVTNQGLGLGIYSTQNTVSGFDTAGAAVSDTSDFGTDPDPDGNGNPNESGENDATTVVIAIDSPLGAATEALVTGFDVTLNLYLENLGAGTLSNVQLANSLDDTFGAGNYTVTALPMFVDDPGTLVLNTNYDGGADLQVLDSGSTLAAGDTAQIQLTVTVDTETDQGNGFGIYSIQSTASGTQPNGVVVSDASDDGTDPDPNGNNDPGEAGEDDPTSIVVAGNPAIGIAKQATVSGNVVTFDFFVENLGDVTVSNVTMEDPLNPVFGSGNYSVTTQPTLVSGADTLLLSTQFFGFSVFDFVIAGGTLRPGETAQIRVVINVTNVTDQGNGLGIYDNSVTVNATGPDGSAVSDISDDGIDPDPDGNGNAGGAGEDDPTRAIIGDEAVIGVAKTATVVGQQVTFDLYLDNPGASALSSLSLIEDLDAVFGAGNYSVNGAPTLVDDPGTITFDAGFDGSGTTQLLDASSTLAALDTAQIQLVVDVTNVVDQGLGLGSYSNQVEVSASAPLGSTFSDLSDDGIDPDPNANGLPNDADENDPTTFSVGTVQVGVAKNATVNGRQVTLDYAIENLGSTPFSTVSLPDDYDALFGAGNYTIVSGPTLLSVPRDLVVNTSFDGSTDTELVASGGLGLGVTEEIQLVVEVNRLVDNGSGFGVYSSQVTVTADSSNDLSDFGTDPDPNGNGDGTEAGENDPTTFTIAQEPVIGIAKTAVVTGRTVTFDLYVQSFGNVDATELAIVENLDGVFGTGNYAITGVPTLIDDPGTLTLNALFDGSSQTGLLSAPSTLAINDTAQIRLSVNVTTVSDQGSGLGNYQNQAEAIATTPDTSTDTDLSDNGSNPDPNGDGQPDGSGEDDPTPVVLEANIGDFVWNDLNGDGVQDIGEPGLTGVTVYLDTNTNGQLDSGEPQDVTSAGGDYGFFNLVAGTYQVSIDGATVPTDFVLTGGTEPVSVTVFAGEDAVGVDFGYQQQDAVIGDLVYNDLNGDGFQDMGEPGISGLTVFFDDNSNGTLDGSEASTVTDGSGAYSFTNLATGTYNVTVESSPALVGFQSTTGGDLITVALAAGEVADNTDFGYQQRDATIGDLIWNDFSLNGQLETGEPGLDGIRVFADLNENGSEDMGEPAATTVNGAYDLTGLAAGSYVIDVDLSTLPVNFVLTTGNLPLTVTIAAGEDFNDADFGFADPLEELRLAKNYTGDPVQQGRTVRVNYLVSNSQPSGATQIAFSDNLAASLPGLVATNLPLFDVCGDGSSVTGTDVITFSGGTLASGQSCNFEVELLVPADAAPGDYVGTTGVVTSTEFVGNLASDTLTVLANSLDVSVTVDNNRNRLTGLDVVPYLITVVNEDAVSGINNVTIDLPLPPEALSATWDCVASGGAVCTDSGSGAIADMVNLPVGGSLVYTWTVSLPDLTTPALDVTVTAGVPVGLIDVAPANNVATDADPVVGQLVFFSGFEETTMMANKLASGKAEIPASVISALALMPADLVVVKDVRDQAVYRIQGRRIPGGMAQYRFLWFTDGGWEIGRWQGLSDGEDAGFSWDPERSTLRR